MHVSVFLPFAVFVFAYGLVSRRIDRTILTAPILAVAYGIALGPAGFEVIHLDMGGEVTRLLAEITLALVLFHDAARIDLRRLRGDVGLPARLLGPGLLGTVALGFGVGLVLLPGLSGWEIALLAALLAPTDAALGQAVVTQKAVPLRVRQALNVESGLNDGLVVPLVAVLTACAAGQSADSAWTWVAHAGRALGYGVFGGAAVGLVAAKLLDRAEASGWMHAGSRRVAVASVPMIAFFAAEALGGSGFLAAFLAGLALGSTTHHIERHLYDFTEDSGELLGQVTWVVFGVAAAPAALECGTPGVILYALLSLTLIRMLPVALALRGVGFSPRTVMFIGWFGPRGLASVVFALAVLGEPEIAGAESLFGVAVWTILLSVVLHGATSAPFARAYGASVDEIDDPAAVEFPAPRSSRISDPAPPAPGP